MLEPWCFDFHSDFPIAANEPLTLQLVWTKRQLLQASPHSIGPDLIALFGSSILGSELLDLFPKRIFNLHVGLADRYRGSSCNFWPIYDRNLGDLGATIIRIDKGIDSGETLAQEWNTDFEAFAETHADLAQQWTQTWSNTLPENWNEDVPTWDAGPGPATRSAGGQVLNALANKVPWLMGGGPLDRSQ